MNNNMMGMNNNMNAPSQQRSGDIFDTLFNPALLNNQESMFSDNRNQSGNQNQSEPSKPQVDPFSNLVNLMK